MKFRQIIIYLIGLIGQITAKWVDETYDVVNIDRTVFPDNERFPEEIQVHFNHYGNAITLNLWRDDETTDLLSESVFMMSKFLPSDVFDDDNREQFSAYTSPAGDTVVVHKEHDSAEPKFYGRYTADNNRYVISSVDRSHVLHRIRRDDSMATRPKLSRRKRYAHRYKRSSFSGDEVVEVVIYADYTIFSFFEQNITSGLTRTELKAYIKTFLKTVTREVDAIYSRLSDRNIPLRVVFQNYQIITKESEQSAWYNAAIAGKLTAFADYYDSMVSKFAFPDVDHVMGLTRANLGNNKVISQNYMCNVTGGGRSVSYVSFQYYPWTLAQGIAKGFNVSFDGEGNATACSSADDYVMSTDYAFGVSDSSLYDRRWTFSNCSIDLFNAWAGAQDITCLTTEDSLTDTDSFFSFPTMGEQYNGTEQCQLQHGLSSTFCVTTGNKAQDCYSDTRGCTNSTGDCVSSYFGERTTCDTGPGPNAICVWGFCRANVTTTTSTTTTATTTTTSVTMTTTSTSSPTMQTGKVSQSSPVPDCTTMVKYVDVDLPGCGCCGGCGCDEACDSCSDGLGRPAQSQTEECVPEAQCCRDKVRITTRFIPDGCDYDAVPGPTTLILEKRGWEEEDLDVKAQVWQQGNEWQVKLVS